MCAKVFCVSSVGMFAAGWRGSAVSVRCFCRGCGEWVFLLNFEGGSLGALGAWLPWWSTISPTLFLRVNFICWFLRACTAAADSPVLQLGVPHQIRSSAATGAVLPGGQVVAACALRRRERETARARAPPGPLYVEDVWKWTKCWPPEVSAIHWQQPDWRLETAKSALKVHLSQSLLSLEIIIPSSLDSFDLIWILFRRMVEFSRNTFQKHSWMII